MGILEKLEDIPVCRTRLGLDSVIVSGPAALDGLPTTVDDESSLRSISVRWLSSMSAE